MCATIVALVALSASAGCSFSSFHTAKMLPQGATRVGGGINIYSFRGDGGSVDTNGYEVTASHGFSDKLELGGKFMFAREASPGEGSVNFFNLMVAPKLSLIPEVLAFTAESGIIMASSSDDSVDVNNIWQTMPGVVFTQTLNEQFDLNVAGKLVLQFEDDFGDYNMAIATNVGLRFLIPDTNVVIFPELGIMYEDDNTEDGYFMQLGFAVQYTFGAPAALPPPAPAPAPAYVPPPVGPMPPPPTEAVPPPAEPSPAPAPAPVP